MKQSVHSSCSRSEFQTLTGLDCRTWAHQLPHVQQSNSKSLSYNLFWYSISQPNHVSPWGCHVTIDVDSANGATQNKTQVMPYVLSRFDESTISVLPLYIRFLESRALKCYFLQLREHLFKITSEMRICIRRDFFFIWKTYSYNVTAIKILNPGGYGVVTIQIDTIKQYRIANMFVSLCWRGLYQS